MARVGPRSGGKFHAGVVLLGRDRSIRSAESATLTLFLAFGCCSRSSTEPEALQQVVVFQFFSLQLYHALDQFIGLGFLAHGPPPSFRKHQQLDLVDDR